MNDLHSYAVKFVLPIVLFVALCGVPAASWGQYSTLNTMALGDKAAAPPAEQPAPVDPATDLANRRADIAKRLDAAKKKLTAAQELAAQQQTTVPPTLSREVELLRQIDLTLSQQEGVFERFAALGTQKNEMLAALETLRVNGPQEQPPYSFLKFDQLRDKLIAEESRREAASIEVTAATEALNRAKGFIAEKDRARRKVKEAADAKNGDIPPDLATELALAELLCRMGRESQTLREIELATEQLEAELQDIQINIFKVTIDWMSKDAKFTAEDLQNKLLELENRELSLKSEVEWAQMEMPELERNWLSARERLEQANDKTPEMHEAVEAARMAKYLSEQRINVLNKRMQRIGYLRFLWKRRFEVISGKVSDADRAKWQEDSETGVQNLDREARLQKLRTDQIRKDLANIEQKLQDDQTTAAAKLHIAEQQRCLLGMIEVYDSDIVGIESARRLHEKLMREMQTGSATEKAEQWVADLWHQVRKIWDYEITSVDDRSITVSKVVGGLVLVILGYWVSRIVSWFFGRRFLPRIGMNDSAAAALQTVAFYVLLLTISLAAMRLVSVPLTVFTFLGGAVAIGVGFGSQNILNNFISGLILLAERPVRIGDLIELQGGVLGTVDHIGPRSTRVRTGTNMQVIVPNSTFLQNNVVNWTLSNDHVRGSVTVHLAYGAQVEKAMRMLKELAVAHPMILAQPEPSVFFEEFGEQALIFKLNFWVRMRTIGERGRIQSDLRIAIDGRFRDEGIPFVSPQRDVRLDLNAPVEVRLRSPEARENDAYDNDRHRAA